MYGDRFKTFIQVIYILYVYSRYSCPYLILLLNISTHESKEKATAQNFCP